jgi:hypothetical protein
VVEEEAARAGLGALQLEAPSGGALAAGAAGGGASSSSAGAGPGSSGGGGGSTTGYTQRPAPGLREYGYCGAVYRCTAPRHPGAVQLLLRHLEANSALLQQRQVLELQAEGSALVALAALRHARHVTVASSSAQELQCTARNLAENAGAVVVERVKCRALQWEGAAAGGGSSLAAEAGRLYDVVLGCLPLAGEREAAAWVAAAAQLLVQGAGAAAVLCCVGGAAGAAGEAAAVAGLVAAEEQQGGDGGEGCRLLVLRRAAA